MDIQPLKNKEQKTQLNLKMCNKHKPKNDYLSYIDWYIWANDMIEKGHQQIQCTKCKHWLFECEM